MKIQFENVSFRYESRKEAESVSTLNFTIASGEFILYAVLPVPENQRLDVLSMD